MERLDVRVQPSIYHYYLYLLAANTSFLSPFSCLFFSFLFLFSDICIRKLESGIFTIWKWRLGALFGNTSPFLACYVNLVSDVFLTSRSIFPKHDIPLFFYTHRSRRPCSSFRSQLMLRYRGDLFPLGTNLG